MDFSTFKSRIEHYADQHVGGLKTQLLLAPKIRRQELRAQMESSNPKKAAVLTLFYPNTANKVEILLTQRASYDGTHSGQISFPGGKFDEADLTLQNTALREAQEEVGINPIDVRVFKKMTNLYIPPSNFMVRPYLGSIDYKPVWKTNHEVERIVEISLDELLNDETITDTILPTSYAAAMKVPCFQFKNGMVWGATAMILSEIKELLK